MRRWLVRTAVVAAAVVAVVVLRATVFAPDPVEVRVAAVQRGRVDETVTNSKAGTVRARRRARLSPQTSGLVTELPVREGDRVEAGDLLLRLDAATQRSRLLEAQRSLEVASARRAEALVEMRRAERELARNRELARQRIISDELLDALESRWEEAVAASEVAGAQVRLAEAEIAGVEAELAKTELVAPFPGVVAEVNPELGEWITPSAPLVPVPAAIDLIDTSSLYVSAPMDEVDSGRIRVGQEVRVTLDSFPDRTFPGAVARIAPYVLDVEAQNRTIEVEVDLGPEARDERILVGTSADVEVVLQSRSDVPWVPTLALLEGERVLVLGENGVLAEREVRVGLENWDRAEIEDGLAVGERVVTSLDREEVRPGVRARAGDAEPAP